MTKQFNKHISYEALRSKNKLNPLTYRDFLIFRKKFLGMFVLRGKKSFSMKILHYILLNLKKLKKTKMNPMKLFFIIIRNVTPFLTLGQKKFGTNIITVPSLLYGNKKNVILLN
jgi:ribosomal protein S7